MKTLEFYDLVKKKKFRTTNYMVKTVNGRKVAIERVHKGRGTY